jgi:class 3 adenylate cyclase
MPDWSRSTLSSNIAKEISQSRRSVTILFTDIVFSTMHWDINGDIRGRLMVDKHNRLVVPIIHYFNGQVVKTIGDSVMAMFNRPEDAVKASIGIQQVLDQARENDDSFDIHVRIGMHTGNAIVEQNDVFGDVVNVASRIENEADGDEILLSEAMAVMLRDQGYFLNKAGVFTFKGKKEPMNVFRCDWTYCKDYTRGINLRSFSITSREKKREQIVQSAIFASGLFLIYYLYLRFALADVIPVDIRMLNPGMFLREGSAVVWLIVLIGMLLMGIQMRRTRQIPNWVQRFVRGGFGLTVGFFVFYIPTLLLPDNLAQYLESSVYESKTEFVEVRAAKVPVYQDPSPRAEEVAVLREGDYGVLQAQRDSSLSSWYEIGLIEDGSGWIPSSRPQPESKGRAEVSRVSSFVFSRRDMFALMAALLGFIWGVFDFRVRPA